MSRYPLIDQDSVSDAVILAAGDYPTHTVPVTILRKAHYVCCCDSAVVSYVRHGNQPDAIVCDGDSLPDALKKKFANILHTESEQDYNDLTKATRYCLSQGYKDIFYLGATGKREDHTLGNISLMAWYMQNFDMHPVMITDHGYFVPARGHNFFATNKGQQISIFNVDCKSIHGKGLKWDTYAAEWLWQGTLNEATGNEVELDADGSYLVYRSYEIKDASLL